MAAAKDVFHLDLDPAQLGASLAQLDDAAQSAFFTAFCKELRSACGTSYRAEMQLFYIAGKLGREDRELLSECLKP